MKRMIFCSAILIAFCCPGMLDAAAPIEILSINIRLSTVDDRDDAWPKRRDFMMEVVRNRPYDFIGGQEVVVHPDAEVDQFRFMKEKLPEYGVLFRSREKDEIRGEGMPVFYRKDRWEPDADEQGVFWLSDTPEVPGSITWEGQSRCPRIVTWALFHEKDAEGKRSGKSLYVYCTHFDHIGEPARQKAAEAIARHLSERKNKAAPVVLMGDLNTGEKSPSIRYFKGEKVTVAGKEQASPLPLVDTFRVLHPEETRVATFHGFKGDGYVYNNVNRVGNKIDYIFVTPDLKTTDAEIIRTKNGSGRYPTDHYPVRATIEFP